MRSHGNEGRRGPGVTCAATGTIPHRREHHEDDRGDRVEINGGGRTRHDGDDQHRHGLGAPTRTGTVLGISSVPILEVGCPRFQRGLDKPTLLVDGERSDLPETRRMGTSDQVAHGHEWRAEIVLGEDDDPLARLLETERTDKQPDGRGRLIPAAHASTSGPPSTGTSSRKQLIPYLLVHKGMAEARLPQKQQQRTHRSGILASC